MRSTALSQDDLENRAISLLEEWGRYQRNEPPPLSSSLHPIYRAMEEWGEHWTSKRVRPSAIVARGRKRHKVDINGRTVQAIPMSPDRTDKGSRSGTKTPERWPEHIERVDRVLAKYPRPVLEALAVYYIWGVSIRSGAQILRVDTNEFRRRLERGRWALIGSFDFVDNWG